MNSNATQGAAYVFTRSGTDWTQQQELTASDGASGDIFGTSLAVSGDNAVIGAPLATSQAKENQGAAYLFIRSGTTWTQQQTLNGADGKSYDNFGSCVALEDNTAIVGADGKTVIGALERGAAYVFQIGKATGDPCGSDTECASGTCLPSKVCAAPPVVDAGSDAGHTGGYGGAAGAATDSGAAGVGGHAGSSGGGGTSAAGSAGSAAAAVAPGPPNSGCGCRTPSDSHAGSLAASMLAAALACIASRRRRK